MLDVVENFLIKYNIISGKVIVAFSAGPDSVFLAHALSKLKEKYNLCVVLCYFNHGWRREAKLEEDFTQEFASKFGFEYSIGIAPSDMKKDEETAREYRYKFLEECASKFNSKVVLTAHNLNDNVETLIYRVIKGTSVSGLTSIPEKRDIFYRPVLTIKKEDILSYLDKNCLKYMLDSSNDNVKYKRNLIRKEIFPLFSKINPNYLDSISNLIDNSINTRKIVSDSVNQTKDSVFQQNQIILDKFIHLSKEIRLEIINDFLFDKLKNRNRKTVLKIDDFILNNDNSKISINSDYFLYVKNNRIFLSKKKPKITFEPLVVSGCGEYLFEDKIITISKEIMPNKFPKADSNYCYLDLNFPLQIRHRELGDIFSPVGLDGSMKLKKFLINQKVTQEDKDKLILLCDKKNVCWIIGINISEKYKVKSKNCYKIEVRDKNE